MRKCCCRTTLKPQELKCWCDFYKICIVHEKGWGDSGVVETYITKSLSHQTEQYRLSCSKNRYWIQINVEVRGFCSQNTCSCVWMCSCVCARLCVSGGKVEGELMAGWQTSPDSLPLVSIPFVSHPLPWMPWAPHPTSHTGPRKCNLPKSSSRHSILPGWQAQG